jgi:hypothetical protein
MEVWQDMLSMGGRLVLINSSLSNIPLYMLFILCSFGGSEKDGYFSEKNYYGKVKKWPRNTI